MTRKHYNFRDAFLPRLLANALPYILAALLILSVCSALLSCDRRIDDIYTQVDKTKDKIDGYNAYVSAVAYDIKEYAKLIENDTIREPIIEMVQEIYDEASSDGFGLETQADSIKYYLDEYFNSDYTDPED